jgi:hypothetical protein
MTEPAMKTYSVPTGDWKSVGDEGMEGLQVRVQFQAHRSTPSWRPPYRLRNVSTNSPGGFAWGYGGSGPVALAHSLLADALADIDEEDLAEWAYSDYVDNKIAKLGQEQGWTIYQQEILRWFEGWKNRRPQGRHDPLTQAILDLRLNWALRQTGHQADRNLWEVREDFRHAVRDLDNVWGLSKLDVAVWVADWLKAHPDEVALARKYRTPELLKEPDG